MRHRLLLGLGEVVDRAVAAVDVPAAEVLLGDVVAHGVADHRRPGDEELGDVAHHHREVAEHRLGGADADDAAEQHVDHRHRGELLGVHRCCRGGRAGTSRRRPTTRGRPALIAPVLSLAALSPSCLLLRHHRGDAAAARRAVEQADRRARAARSTAGRGSGSCAPIAPSAVAAARGEVVGADDRRAALDRAPAADVVGRREVGDVAVVVVGGEAGEAADLAEACRRRAAASMRSRQVSLPRLRWRTTPGSVEPGARRSCGDAPAAPRPRRASASSLSSAAARRSGPGGAGRRLDHGEDLACRRRRRPTDSDANVGDDAGAGRRDGGLHLHGADDEQRVAGVHRRRPRERLMSTIEPRIGLSTASCPGGTGKAAGRRGALAPRPRPQRSRPAGRGTAARPVFAFAGSIASASSVVRASPARNSGCARIARSWSRLVGSRDVELVQRARASGRRRSRSSPRSRTGRSPWPAADRTAAAARSPT